MYNLYYKIITIIILYYICSMWVSGDWEHPVLVVERENLKSVKVLDALQLDCTNYANITSVQGTINNVLHIISKL